MTYFKRVPDSALRPYVESIGIQDSAERSTARTRILPTGTMDLLFHYGDRFVRRGRDGDAAEPVAYVTGQRSSPIDVAASGGTGIVIVALYPWGLSAFTTMPAHLFADDSIDLADVFGSGSLSALQDRLFEARTPARRIQLVEHFLLRQLRPESVDRVAIDSANVINLAGGTTIIAELAQRYGMSKRQLDRRFLDAVGTTPKRFARVMKFQKALFGLSLGTNLADVAARAGYHDQSHMNRDFRQFAWTTPEHLVRSRRETPLTACFNGAPVSHFYNTTYLA
ncbi:MAG: helix-turn-helix transcriptional regulator [Pseudomonadales bacterium]|nr:helix-turn-helix transcriptional regulator [Pseudomonadales bacterium]